MRLISILSGSFIIALAGCKAELQTQTGAPGTPANTVGAAIGSANCPVCPTACPAPARPEKIKDESYVKILSNAPEREKLRANSVEVAQKSREAANRYDRLIVLARDKAKKHPNPSRDDWYSYNKIQKLVRAKRLAEEQAAAATAFASRLAAARAQDQASIVAAQEAYDRYYYENLAYNELYDELERELSRTDYDDPEYANVASQLRNRDNFEIKYEESPPVRTKKIRDESYTKIFNNASEKEKLRVKSIAVAQKSKEAARKYEELIALAQAKAKKHPNSSSDEWYSYSGIQKLKRAKKLAEEQSVSANEFASRIAAAKPGDEASMAAAEEAYDEYYYENLELEEISDEVDLPSEDADVPQVANLAADIQDDEDSFEIEYEETTVTQSTQTGGEEEEDDADDAADENSAAPAPNTPANTAPSDDNEEEDDDAGDAADENNADDADDDSGEVVEEPEEGDDDNGNGGDDHDDDDDDDSEDGE